MDDTGPVELLPPAGLKRLYLTMRYANGVELYHTNIGASITFRAAPARSKSAAATSAPIRPQS